MSGCHIPVGRIELGHESGVSTLPFITIPHRESNDFALSYSQLLERVANLELILGMLAEDINLIRSHLII